MYWNQFVFIVMEFVRITIECCANRGLLFWYTMHSVDYSKGINLLVFTFHKLLSCWFSQFLWMWFVKRIEIHCHNSSASRGNSEVDWSSCERLVTSRSSKWEGSVLRKFLIANLFMRIFLSCFSLLWFSVCFCCVWNSPSLFRFRARPAPGLEISFWD